MEHKIWKRYKILKGEKIIYVLLAILLVSIPVCNVFTKATLSKTNIEVERLRKDIEKQSGVNEGLTMKINELASLDKIQEVAKENGLSYYNDNIKVIQETEKEG